jgi:hypothetical protein
MLEENFELSSLWSFPSSVDAPLPGPSRLSGVSQKKQHEIDVLLDRISPHLEQVNGSSVFDYCGGVGHLAAAVAERFSQRVTTFDISTELQDKGRQRYASLCSGSTLDFVCMDLRQCPPDPLIPIGLGDAAKGCGLAIGLHTCGDLATHFIDSAIVAGLPSFFSIPCCYYKGHKEVTGSAQIAQISPEAMWLASRSHCQVNIGADLGYRVKYYRFMMHLYLCEVCGLNQFVGLGHSAKALYRGTFEEYGREQLRRLNVEDPESHDRSLSAFASSSPNVALVKNMIASSVIRNSFGRLVEVLIVLRRAASIADSGYRVSVEACFDERLSPRNLLITALR